MPEVAVRPEMQDADVTKSAVALIAAVVLEDLSIRAAIERSVTASGTLPMLRDQYDAVIAAVLDRVTKTLCAGLGATLPDVLSDDRAYLQRVRRFFETPSSSYSHEELAAIWDVTPECIRDVFHDETARSGASEVVIAAADAASAALSFNVVRPCDLERALGDHFTSVRPQSWRTVPVLIQLPRFIADTMTRALEESWVRNLAAHVERFIVDCFLRDWISSRADGGAQP